MEDPSRQWFWQGLTGLRLETMITREYLKVNQVYEEGERGFFFYCSAIMAKDDSGIRLEKS
jgi:hypothetical protein